MIDFLLHIDKHLSVLISHYHGYTYLILFGMIFIETGIVVTPFIPGDSLLFATGALVAAGGTGLNLYLLAGVLILAAFTGDMLNYRLGAYFGPKVFRPGNRILKPEYYHRAEAFFREHGGKSIAFGRFMPLIRTFVPFVAGFSRMHPSRFLWYNLAGGCLWVLIILFLGFSFGNIPLIKNHFSLFVLAVILLSMIPVLVTVLRRKNQQ